MKHGRDIEPPDGFETDVPTEASRSLHTVHTQLDLAWSDAYAWKWVLIALHSAVQSFLVGSMSGTDQLGALRPDIRDEWLTAYYNGTRDFPPEKLDFFPSLYSRMKEEFAYCPSPEVDRHIAELNRYRNQLIHFTPMTYLFHVDTLPDLALSCLEVVEFLGWDSGRMEWGLDRHTELTARREFDASRTALLQFRRAFAQLAERVDDQGA